MSAIVKVTENALRKHIVDATLPVQNFLRENNIHDFDSQELAKIERIPVRVIPSGKEILLSLQRPRTHDGKFKRIGVSKELIKELELTGGDTFEFSMQAGVLVVQKLSVVQKKKDSPVQMDFSEIKEKLEPTVSDLSVGSKYTRDDIHNHYFGKPVPKVGTGNWTSGYVRVGDELVVFINIGTPGRTGHDFDNHYDDSTKKITWFGKPESHSEQPTFQKLIKGEMVPYFFARWDSKDPQFLFLGEGRITEYQDGQPTVFSSGQPTTTLKMTLECFGLIENNSKIQEEGVPYKKSNKNNQIKESMVNFPDRFIDWQSSKPGAVRRPFTGRENRPLGPDVIIKTSLVKRLIKLAEELCLEAKPDNWVKPRGIFLVGGAGNGKSDGLECFLDILAQQTNNPEKVKLGLEQIFSKNERKLSISVKEELEGLNIGFEKIEIVQDATEGDGTSKGVGELLLEDLSALEDEKVLLICCINRGILENARAFSRTSGTADNLTEASSFLDNCTRLIDPHAFGKPCWPDEQNNYIWPLDLESLVDDFDGKPAFVEVLEKCTEETKNWDASVVKKEDSSPISSNLLLLSSDQSKAYLCSLLNDFEILSGEKWTFRDLFSLLSHIFSGGFIRKENETPSTTADTLALPPTSAGSLRRVNSTMDALRATLPQLLFPNWPTHKVVKKKAEELIRRTKGESKLSLLKNLVNYIEKEKLPEPKLPVEKILRGAWSEKLDPAKGMEFVIEINEGTLTERMLEDNFAVSVSDGIAYIEKIMPNFLGSIEKAFLELLISIEQEIDGILEINSGTTEQTCARDIQKWIGQLGLIVIKRFTGVKFGHGHESNDIRFFKENVYNSKFLGAIRRDFRTILGEGDDENLKVELNLGLCQPRGVFKNKGIILEARHPQIDYELIKDRSERPGPPSSNFIFSYDNYDKVEVPFSYQLFKQLSAQRAYLIPACLDPMTRGFIEHYRMNLDGIAVRSWSKDPITIRKGVDEELFRGDRADFQNELSHE
jgi:hypothetical protein